ncbi:MAG: ATP-binding protein [Chitinophagaceae bacterium]|nr:ATP-binding protein [Chitinophagaceae bacterium]
MITPKEIQDRRKEIAEIRHAESVFRDITARLNERENYEKRWFWELLQNAKDSTNNEVKTVKVKIEISDEEVSFSHTGLPFELDDILSLIIQGSSKGDKPGKTGRFGTGFMTTYLLSKKVTISGELTNSQGCFQFLLNRDATGNEDFIKLQNQSNIEFEGSIQAESYLGDSEFQTKFTYGLDLRGKETAEAGLHCLDELIPVTQLFNEQIESVHVIKNNISKTFTKKKLLSNPIGNGTITKWQIITLTDNIPQQTYYPYTFETADAQTCIITAYENGIEKIIRLSSNYPRLYFTFPLIGTEEIGIPVIINSENFKPRIERDGIYLKSSEENDATSNKSIIENVLPNSLRTFAKYFSVQQVKGIPELFDFGSCSELTWIDHDWLKKVKKNTIDHLKELKVINCHDQVDPFSLIDVKIPLSANEIKTEALWNLLKSYKNIYVPLAEDLNRWSDIVVNLSWLEEELHKPYNFPFVYGIDKLVNLVSVNNNIDEIRSNLSVLPEVWLNAFYTLVIEEYKNFPLDKKIALNYEGSLREGEGMLWDNCKDDELIQLSNILKINFGEKLFSEKIVPFHIVGVGNFTKETAVNEIISKLNEISIDQLAVQENLECHGKFLKWIVLSKRTELLKDLKIVTGADNEEKYSLEFFRTGEHLFMAPQKCYAQTFPLYTALVRERDCLNDIYFNFLSATDFQWLDSLGLIHASPLVTKTELATPKIIEYLVVDESDLGKLKDKEGQYIYRPKITYTDFAYLTGNDGHIYVRSKSQKASSERFKFLLEEAVEKDPLFENEIQEVLIEGLETPIKFNSCVWIARAKRLQWVYYKGEESGQDIKFFNESPSAKNLSELLKYNDTLVKSIRGSKQQLFLNKLGVGVSELIRSTLLTEELRFSWDKAITNMITSNADPELVQEIFSNTDIQKEYEKRLQQKKLISRNQQIGTLVEQLFRESILELKNEGYEISIDRKPFGSDYIITDESSDLVNEKKQEEVFEINDWLVELKATGKSYAAMTELQAKTASQKKDKYALVVVELDESPIDLDYLRAKALVVDTIGNKIEKLLPEFNDMQIKKLKLTSGEDGISVNIEENNIRFRVQSAVWKDKTLSIREFIQAKFKKDNTEVIL